MEKRKSGFGGKTGGFKGDKKPYAKREGGYERKPRAEGERSYKPREGAATGEKRPYVKREGASSYGERKPYAKREGGFGGEKRPYRPRVEGDSAERKPYVKREGGYDRAPRAEGERSYKPREGGSSYGERKPYVKREGGYDRAPRAEGERSYKPREGGSSYGERKPYVKREGGYDRAPRAEGERSYKPREGGSSYGERKPYVKREGGYDRAPREGGFERSERPAKAWEDRGEGKQARFDGKRPVKHERVRMVEGERFNQDGWLVGTHAVVSALQTGRRAVRKIWLLAEARGVLADVLAEHPEWIVETRSRPDFDREFGEMVHQGVAALMGNLPQPSLPELLATKPKLLVALDQVTDPHNLGAIVRSCAAFGAAGVLVTEHRAAGLSATAAKVAAGAMETVPVVEITNLVQSLEMLKENGFTVLGLAGEAEGDIAAEKVSGPVCVVVGSEGDGLRRLTRETCDKLVKIAISDAVESLNVSVATGVALALLKNR